MLIEYFEPKHDNKIPVVKIKLTYVWLFVYFKIMFMLQSNAKFNQRQEVSCAY